MEMPCCHVGASEGALKLTLVALANAAAALASMKDLRVTKVASISSLLPAASQAGQARCEEWAAAALSSANGVRSARAARANSKRASGVPPRQLACGGARAKLPGGHGGWSWGQPSRAGPTGPDFEEVAGGSPGPTSFACFSGA